MVANIEIDTFNINNITLKLGFRLFTEKLKKNNFNLLNKKYFYVNIWSINCKPCYDEMPFLNTLQEALNKEIGYIMVSSHSDAAVNNFFKNKKIQMDNFYFVNEMNDFIFGVFNEIEVKDLCFPLHVILNKNGKCLAYLFGSIHDENSAAPLINFIKRLEK